MIWDELVQIAATRLLDLHLSDVYIQRLHKEIAEINKQGANEMWVEYYTKGYRWDSNPLGLVLPWLLGMTSIDPVEAKIEPIVKYETDFPDIDTDFPPWAREPVKQHAAEKYIHVCSVGNWLTYNPKLALTDVARTYGANVDEIMAITKQLPDEFDELNLTDHAKILTDLESDDVQVRADAHKEHARYALFYDYLQRDEMTQKVVSVAYQLIGKIKTQSTHAGGVIIADRPIEECVPLTLVSGKWTSQWTEGKKTQLSKFGLVKFDILGVKTIGYINKACELIKKSHGIEIDWSEMDPHLHDDGIPIAGYATHPGGEREPILLNDPDALLMANQLRTESVFQIETPIQKDIIRNGKVRNFWDLVVYNALGRPGPMDEIPHYIENRDHNKNWGDTLDQRIAATLRDTHGIICYQEQLTSMWIILGKFTVPEAEAARKVISKKWADKLAAVGDKWVRGAIQTLGEEEAKRLWDLMVSFGRYAFNKSHAVAYSIVTYRCLYLKAHYPAEWWAAVLSDCPDKKITDYMAAARKDGVEFDTIDVNNISRDFTVVNGRIVPGLTAIKGIGDKACEQMTSVIGPFSDIDDVVAKVGKNKGTFERLIKLGAFDAMHPNRNGLWNWYQYKYASDSKPLRDEVNAKLKWSDHDIEVERERQRAEYRRLYPTKKKLPKSVDRWTPKMGPRYPYPTRDQVMQLYPDFEHVDKLKFEKEFLGYYWHSPLGLYHTKGYTAERAKVDGIIEGVVEGLTLKRSRKSNSVFYILHLNDGVETVDVVIWSDVYRATDRKVFLEGTGVKIHVQYNEDRRSFKIAGNTHIIPLVPNNQEPPPDCEETQVVPQYEEGVLW